MAMKMMLVVEAEASHNGFPMGRNGDWGSEAGPGAEASHNAVEIDQMERIKMRG